MPSPNRVPGASAAGHFHIRASLSQKIPVFRGWQPPALRAPAPREDFRGSASSRGYDHRWTRLSLKYRRQHPFCEECERHGRDALADLVDHVIPLRKPFVGPRLEVGNLQSLCARCHSGIKAALEREAEATGQIAMLAVWVRFPEKRPVRLRAPKIG
ncbi:HNH endonuclease [Prosthecomicrobium hirschii]|uniref:HNH endonuclease n=1 Tax=Prosthecodimorpha hirschii TaxID=665126 RepID=UPI00221EEE85|nr:HNH endonuclease [Prosthecomicrobium hirschii]MCW1844137.1 HNH endonuclease [Prosthecomicrobium hirschii]